MIAFRQRAMMRCAVRTSSPGALIEVRPSERVRGLHVERRGAHAAGQPFRSTPRTFASCAGELPPFAGRGR